MTKKDILCNMCGLTTKLPISYGEDAFDHEYFYGLIDATVQGGYESTPGCGLSGALDDLTNYKFSLCEFCLDHLFSKFVIPPQTSTGHAIAPDFLPAAQRVKEDYWRKDKEQWFLEQDKRSEARKNSYQYQPTSLKVLAFREAYSHFTQDHSPYTKSDQLRLLKIKDELDIQFTDMSDLERSEFPSYVLGLNVNQIPKDSEIYLQSDIDQWNKYCEIAGSYKKDLKGNPVRYGFYADSHKKENLKILNRIYFTMTPTAQKMVDGINNVMNFTPKKS